MPDLQFKVGDVEFTDMEVPEELGDLGAVQSIALHEFAGGIRSIQVFGSFPRAQRWTGILIGTGAHNRARELKRLCTEAEPLTLEYNGWSFFGILTIFKVVATRSQWEIHYEAEFEPAEDNSQNTQPPVASTPQTLLPMALQVANNQANNPASGAILANVPEKVQQIQDSINDALLANFGNLGAVPQPTILGIQQLITTARDTLAAGPLLSTEQATVTAARDLDSTLQVVNWLLENVLPPAAEIDIANPNLFVLAAAYYDGDVSKWELIAKENGLLTPYPIGTFHLVIPVDTGKRTAKIPVMI